jgi:hypothetical protein
MMRGLQGKSKEQRYTTGEEGLKYEESLIKMIRFVSMHFAETDLKKRTCDILSPPWHMRLKKVQLYLWLLV